MNEEIKSGLGFQPVKTDTQAGSLGYDAVLGDFRRLWAEADALWDRRQATPAFAGYVGSDFEAVFETLLELQGRAVTFLEWGSGLGVITIMASRMGFDACGIESEQELVAHSRSFAQTYGPAARFSHGSFIPDDFQWNVAGGDETVRTANEMPSGYAALNRTLSDFDVVYAYPWPSEQTLFRNILRNCGKPSALLLRYDVRRGLECIEMRPNV